MGIEIIIIGAVVAVACAIPGVFLVLRRMSLMSDAISHSVLLGIVVGFFISGSVESPLLIIGAVLVSMLTVVLTELLYKTKLVKSDAAIGLVFPALFSIGVILVSKYASNVHIDVDAVLVGEIALAPLDRMILWGLSLPRTLVTMSIILVMNIVLVLLFFKEIKLATFDPELASSLGLNPSMIHYGLMLSVSITAVGSFDSVGAILVVAFMIAPAASAYLITDNMVKMVLLSALFGVLSTVSGYYIAHFLDVSVAGMMATMTGVLFILVFLFTPRRGYISRYILKKEQKWDFAQKMLTVHLLHHEGSAESAFECSIGHLTDHINWDTPFANGVLKRARENQLIEQTDGTMILTEKGRQAAVEAMNL